MSIGVLKITHFPVILRTSIHTKHCNQIDQGECCIFFSKCFYIKKGVIKRTVETYSILKRPVCVAYVDYRLHINPLSSQTFFFYKRNIHSFSRLLGIQGLPCNSQISIKAFFPAKVEFRKKKSRI